MTEQHILRGSKNIGYKQRAFFMAFLLLLCFFCLL